MRASIIVVVALQAGVASADVELKNDTFESGDAAVFQAGFVAQEIGAVRFVAPTGGRTLQKVQFLFGGSTASQTMRINVYDDTAGTPEPGNILYFGDFTMTGSDSAMQETPTTDMEVVLPAQFRVGVVFNHNGTPTIANDNDNTNTPGRNFIFAQGAGWIASSLAGVKGDWIIRAFVSGEGGGADGGAVGGPCAGNADCPTGQFCETIAGVCTFECRMDEDCGGGTCSSLGRCVGADGGGCCRTDRGGEVGALVFGALFGLVVLRRRKRCA